MNIYEKLLAVQSELKAPKSQFNSFGNYKYRNCEDILEAAKPLAHKVNALITLSDEIKMLGDRYYVEATATFIDCESGEHIDVTASAREEASKKGMDSSQITGASSSYARKYALGGLLDIDDNKDSDATNKHGKDETPPHTEPEKYSENEQNGDKQTDGDDGDFIPKCAMCGNEISIKVHDYSVGKYKKPLCYSCQKKA